MRSLFEIQQRHAAHYASLLRATNELYIEGGDSIKRGLALFDLEWLNIQTGHTWAVANTKQDETAAQLCSDYPDWPDLLDLRLHPRERIAWLEAALAAARRLKIRDAEGAHLGNLGSAYYALGDRAQAISHAEAALKIFEQIESPLAEKVRKKLAEWERQ